MSTTRPTFYRSSVRRRNRRTRRLGLWLTSAGLVVVGYVVLFGETGLLAVRAEARAVADLERRIAEIEAATAELHTAIDDLAQPGSFTLEKVAREQYLMTRPGEQVLHVLEGPEPAPAP